MQLPENLPSSPEAAGQLQGVDEASSGLIAYAPGGLSVLYENQAMRVERVELKAELKLISARVCPHQQTVLNLAQWEIWRLQIPFLPLSACASHASNRGVCSPEV